MQSTVKGMALLCILLVFQKQKPFQKSYVIAVCVMRVQEKRGFVISFFKKELDAKTVQEYLTLYDKASDYGIKEVVLAKGDDSDRKAKKKLTNVKDSVRTLGLCRKINKTLNQKQKVIVLIKLLELLAADRSFTPQRMEIINTVSTVFKCSS